MKLQSFSVWNQRASSVKIVIFVHLFRAPRIYNYTVPVGTISTLVAMHAIFNARPRRLFDVAGSMAIHLAMLRSLILPHASHATALPVKATPNATLWATASKHCGPVINHSKCTSPSSPFNPAPFPCHYHPNSRPDCCPSYQAPPPDPPV
jgi:hypothetical protein